ncbi:MAG: flagellar protein FliS [Planctomycetes bacterium]|nr:flagellar protein FliS [Planctomycetota bacterium]
MATSARSYLETQVNTATPQRLRLMLIDGALRLATRARESLRAGKLGEATEAIVRCQAVVGELGGSPDANKAPELARQIGDLYRFVHRSLNDGQLERSEQRLTDAITVLEIERETWQLVCQELEHRPMPHLNMGVSTETLEGLSLEA